MENLFIFRSTASDIWFNLIRGCVIIFKNYSIKKQSLQHHLKEFIFVFGKNIYNILFDLKII